MTTMQFTGSLESDDLVLVAQPFAGTLQHATYALGEIDGKPVVADVCEPSVGDAPTTIGFRVATGNTSAKPAFALHHGTLSQINPRVGLSTLRSAAAERFFSASDAERETMRQAHLASIR